MLNKYHGKVLKYSDTLSADEKRIFQNSLPKRSDFLDPVEVEKVKSQIRNGERLFFHPNDLVEQHYKDDNRLVYKLILMGVLEDGSKAGVVLDNIDVSFDFRVPDGAESWSFEREVNSMMRENEIYCTNIEHLEHKPFKLFSEKTVPYLRLHFNTLFQRRKALDLFRYKTPDPDKPWEKTNIITYTMKNGQKAILNDWGTPRVETASDDLTCYYRKAAREYKFHLAGWNQIHSYELIRNNDYLKRYSVPYIFKLDVHNINDCTSLGIDLQSQAYKHLIKDKSMIGGWDLETFAPVSTGNAPEPDKVFNEHGKEGDVIFLDSVPFSWYWSTESLIRVAVTEMPAPPRDDCLIIQCTHQIELIKIKALIMERMAPEFLVGFNDGSYDWPFVLRRAEGYDKKHKTGLADFMKRHMSVMPYTDINKKYAIRGKQTEKIKLEQGQYYEHETFNVPGFITIDVRGIFMQMFPKAEKSNLNFFLAANKLGSKEDMPYQTMFKIYRLVRHIREITGSTEWDDIFGYAQDQFTEHGPDHKPFENLLSKLPGDLSKIDNSSYNIDKLTCLDIVHLLGGAEAGGPSNMGATQVINYCNIDAKRCCDLLRVRNVIPDRREVANLSYTSMYDAFYRAGGVKVRNLVMAYACLDEWNLACPNISTGIKDKRKYPGAYVVSPTKGLGRDHKIVKRKRRENLRNNMKVSTDIGQEMQEDIVIDIGEVSPDSPKFNKSLLDDIKHQIVQQVAKTMFGGTRMPKDENDENDRPLTGLDFSSLYPSLMMAYNLSPEKVVLDKQRMENLRARGYQFLHVRFRYGLKDQAEDQKELIEAWIVQHNHPARAMIQEEVARARTAARNSHDEQKHWTKYVNPEITKKANAMYKKTSLDDWREFNMGLYPYILKDLYDRRSRIKKIMGYYAEPQEFLRNVYKTKRLDELKEMSLDEQQQFILEFCRRNIAEREETYQKTQKSFHKWKVHAAKEVLEFFEKEWITENGEFFNLSIDQMSDEINFKVGYYNTNQLALKVYMNTFYGETGNQLSPFFLIAVAGGITSWGQYNTKMVKDFVSGELFRVLYGDTDSLYICPPEHFFKDLDDAYEQGKITKLEYWTKMVEITMEVLDKFKDEVNDLLMLDNSTPFLKMAYEEVLWPFALTGKKKYIGIAHEGIVNLFPCMPECTLDEFMASKLVFIRGLEIIKRGSSEFLKQICFEVFKEAFCINETRTLKQIVEHKLKDVSSKSWNYDMFSKSAKYKLPSMNVETGKMNPGNTSVLRFVERMSMVEKEYPELGIKSPEVGDRFKYVVVKRYPYKYDARGRQNKISMSDKYEYLESLDNVEYQKLYGKLEIDIDYYITHEIVGQFARFIIYHPDYDHYFKPGMDDDEYKQADAKAWTFAKNQLTKFYNARYATRYAKKGKLHQKIFKTANLQLQGVLEKQYGSAADLFAITSGENTDRMGTDDQISLLDNNIQTNVFQKFIEHAKKLGVKYAAAQNMSDIVGKKAPTESMQSVKIFRKQKPNAVELYRICVLDPDSYYRQKRRLLQSQESELTNLLKKMIPEFQKVHESKLSFLEEAIESIRIDNNLDAIGNDPVAVGGKIVSNNGSDELTDDIKITNDIDLGYIKIDPNDFPDSTEEEIMELENVLNDPDPHTEMVNKFYNKFIKLVSVYQQNTELEAFRDSLKDLRTHRVDPQAPPRNIQKADLRREFSEWLASDAGGGYKIGW